MTPLASGRFSSRRARNSCWPQMLRGRAAVDEACRRVTAGQRIVAISGYAEEARRFADLAQDRLGEACKVLTHLADYRGHGGRVDTRVLPQGGRREPARRR